MWFTLQVTAAARADWAENRSFRNVFKMCPPLFFNKFHFFENSQEKHIGIDLTFPRQIELHAQYCGLTKDGLIGEKQFLLKIFVSNNKLRKHGRLECQSFV